MSQKLRPYPEYKDAGLPWLGKMPAHWEIIKTKFLFSERVEKGFETEPLLAATQTKGVIPKNQYENRTVIAQKDLHLLKLVNVGDFVISLRSFQGGIEYAYYKGIISPAYTIMKPSHKMSSGLFRHLFKSKPFIQNLSVYVTGIREGQNIDYFKFKNSYLPLPNIEEQDKITLFLDAKTKPINRFISNKLHLIKLLNEQKQAIINHAVTRGINPNVRLKSSGVEYLGDIPKHWIIKRLKLLARNVTQNVTTKEKDEIYIALENIESWTGRLILPKEEIPFESQVKRFISGDILFGKLRPYLAKVTRAQSDGVCVSELLILRPPVSRNYA